MKNRFVMIKKWGILFFVLIVILGYKVSLPYRYSFRIAQLKAENASDFAIFPERLPESAKSAKWVCFPGFMQGAPFYVLSFKADNEYIQALVRQYENTASVYSYDTEDWSIRRKLPSVKNMHRSIDAENLKIYETNYNTSGWDYFSGFFVDEENGIVGFYLKVCN